MAPEKVDLEELNEEKTEKIKAGGGVWRQDDQLVVY